MTDEPSTPDPAPAILRDPVTGRVLPGSAPLNPLGRPRGSQRVELVSAARRMAEESGKSLDDVVEALLRRLLEKAGREGDGPSLKLALELLGRREGEGEDDIALMVLTKQEREWAAQGWAKIPGTPPGEGWIAPAVEQPELTGAARRRWLIGFEAMVREELDTGDGGGDGEQVQVGGGAEPEQGHEHGAVSSPDESLTQGDAAT